LLQDGGSKQKSPSPKP